MNNNFQKGVLKILGVFLIMAILKLENNSLFFGKMINSFFPCNNVSENSFPCYGIYDIGLMIVCLSACIFLLIWAFIDLIKIRKK